jgi:integrase
MATFKICIRPKDQRVDGTWNIKVRVTHNRRIGFIGTDYYITKKNLEKDFEILEHKNRNNENLYKSVGAKIDKYRSMELAIGEKANTYSVAQLMQYFKTDVDEIIDFVAWGRLHVKAMRAKNRTQSANTYEYAINKLIEYTGFPIIPISMINTQFCKKFEEWDREHKNGKKVVINSSTTIHNRMGAIKAMFNTALAYYNKEDAEVLRIRNNPFLKGRYVIPPPNNTKPRNLSIEIIRAIRDYNKTSLIRDVLARDIFMMSFYMIGMNTVDLFNCPPIGFGGKLTYNRFKTKDRRTDDAEIQVWIQPEMLPYIEKYKSKDKKHAFNFHTKYISSYEFNRALNKGLKNIEKELELNLPKPLTTYYARHSWATLATNDCNIDKQIVHEALNHANEEMKMTDKYVFKDWKKINNANRIVLDLLAKKEKEPALIVK